MEAETLQSLHNEVDECLASLEEWREQRRKETRKMFVNADVVVLCSRQSEVVVYLSHRKIIGYKKMNVPVE